jgi:hypothetical protein
MAERLLHLLEDRGVNESASGDAASTVIGSHGWRLRRRTVVSRLWWR